MSFRRALAFLSVAVASVMPSMAQTSEPPTSTLPQTTLQNPAIQSSMMGDGSGGGFGGGSEPYMPRVEWEKRQDSEWRMEAYGADILGDSIDPATGAITFETTDVSLPGNSALPVAITRKREQGDFFYAPWEMGSWRLTSVPRIYVEVPGQGDHTNAWTTGRCTQPTSTTLPTTTVPPLIPGSSPPTQIRSSEYSNGVRMDIPGEGTKPLLSIASKPQFPSDAKWATVDNWYLTCIPGASEGFNAYSTDGRKYRFDREVTVGTAPLQAITFTSTEFSRNIRMMMATEVTDVHGNWVRYDYDTTGRLTSIYANDGRRINLAYAPGSNLIASVTSNPGTTSARTWSYTYQSQSYQSPSEGQFRIRPNALQQVLLPDGVRTWDYGLAALSATSTAVSDACSDLSTFVAAKHPDGVFGVFLISELIHRKGAGAYTTKSNRCGTTEPTGFPGSPNWQTDGIAWYGTIGVTRKTLNYDLGGNIQTAVWDYEYEHDYGRVFPPNDCTIQLGVSDPLELTNWTIVTNPDGAKTKHWHFWTDDFCGRNPAGGRPARVDTLSSSGAVLESTTYSYIFGTGMGQHTLPNGDISRTTTTPTHAYEVKSNRGGDEYNARYGYELSQSSASYSYGSPTSIDTWSTTSGGWSGRRVVQNNYVRRLNTGNDGKAQVVALLDQMYAGSATSLTLVDDFDHDARGRIVNHQRYGAQLAQIGWHTSGVQAGLLNTITDSIGRVTTYQNYYRGVPRTVTRPDGKSVTRGVEDNGWIMYFTDAKNQTTSFARNGATGWLTQINRPGAWSNTTITYSGMGQGLVQTATSGQQRTIVTYNKMFQPLSTVVEPVSGGGLTTYTRNIYDGLGRVVFSSLPSASPSAPYGTATSYDGLGRVTQVSETAPGGGTTSYAYLTGNKTRVTNALGQQTTTTSTGFGSPDDGNPVKIQQPEGITTDMSYDIFGNLLTARQYGNSGGYSVDQTQRWSYDSRYRVCRHYTPETGSKLFAYNAANQLTSYAEGQGGTTGCATPPASVAVALQYDVLGRPTVTNFPNGTPDIVRAYDDNGNVTSVLRGSTQWTYAYNEIDLVELETLAIDGRTYAIDHAYNNDGALASTRYPSNRLYEYAPNGLGQPTKVKFGAQNFAHQAAYHPDGAISQFTYGGHGLVYKNIKDARLLTTGIEALKSGGTQAMKFTYVNDALGRVTSVTDHITSGQNRSFTYDAAGRLATAAGPWGAGSFSYDALGNIRRKQLGSTVVEMAYDANNRLLDFRDTREQNLWQRYLYDARGNVIDNGTSSLGGYEFTYDFANQPTQVRSGSTVIGAYTYDGNLKRVKQVQGGETVYSIYSVDGRLLHRDNATTGEKDDHLFLGGMEIARSSDVSTDFTHTDHLGSPVAQTSWAGGLNWREDYTPYGEKRQNPTGNRDSTGYTGHVQDHVTGLTYMQARFYDPVVGRFLSNDPVGFATGGVGYFNRYAYVQNDPINATDPTGMCTGSRIKNSDSTCASTGGFKTDVGGYMQGVSRQRALTQLATSVLISAASAPSGQSMVEDNPAFQRASDSAWDQSNADGPAESKREVGFVAVAKWTSITTVSIRIFNWTVGIDGNPEIREPLFPSAGRHEAVIWFHTHPWTVEEGYKPGPSRSDLRLRDDVTGVIRNKNGLVWYGKKIY